MLSTDFNFLMHVVIELDFSCFVGEIGCFHLMDMLMIRLELFVVQSFVVIS